MTTLRATPDQREQAKTPAAGDEPGNSHPHGGENNFAAFSGAVSLCPRISYAILG